MIQDTAENLEKLSRDVAEEAPGPDSVEQVEAVAGVDYFGRAPYDFSFLIRLDRARLVSNSSDETQPTDAHLRRAVSTAYYALFHKVLRSAAQRFMGPDQERRAGFTILYRSFDHRHMKLVCLALRVSTLKDRYG